MVYLEIEGYRFLVIDTFRVLLANSEMTECAMFETKGRVLGKYDKSLDEVVDIH